MNVATDTFVLWEWQETYSFQWWPKKKKKKSFAALIGTHMTLEGGEVNVGNEEDRLGLEISHHLKDGHIVTFLEHWYFHVCNFEGKTAGSNLIFMQ